MQEPIQAPPFALHPFQALRLTSSRLGDPASARLFARPFRRVPERLSQWEQQGLLTRDQTAALYVHEYTSGGLTVRGLVGALDLRPAPSGTRPRVLPHEAVHARQAHDLARRMDEMHLNPAPILLVRHGGAHVTTRLADLLQGPPVAQYDDRGQRTHRFWRIEDPDAAQFVAADLAHGDALIADGHHRHAAYLDLQRQHPGTAWDRGLAMVVDQDDTPLHLGAIHRVFPRTSWAELKAALEDDGAVVAACERQQALGALGPSTLVAYDGRTWARIDLRVPTDDLAVCVVHGRVLGQLPAARVDYHHTVQEALSAVDGPGAGVALLMPSPDFDLVLRHGREGRVLPEKATSFQPKPPVGAIMRRTDLEP